MQGSPSQPPAADSDRQEEGIRVRLLEPAAGTLKYSSHIAGGGEAVSRCIVTEGEFHLVFEMLVLHTQGSHKGTLVGQVQINT